MAEGMTNSEWEEVYRLLSAYWFGAPVLRDEAAMRQWRADLGGDFTQAERIGGLRRASRAMGDVPLRLPSLIVHLQQERNRQRGPDPESPSCTCWNGETSVDDCLAWHQAGYREWRRTRSEALRIWHMAAAAGVEVDPTAWPEPLCEELSILAMVTPRDES